MSQRKTSAFPGSAERNLSICLVFPTLLYYAFITFAGSLKEDFRFLCRGLSIIRGVPYIPLKEPYTKLCDLHLSAREQFAHKILSDQFHCLHNDLSKCRFTFRSRPSSVNIFRNWTIPYLIRILANWELVMSEFYTISG